MAKYRMQRDGDIKTIDEKRLRKKLRTNDLSGLELVRRDDEEDWVQLCETDLFRDEVPFMGDPIFAARRRQIRGFMGHLSAWIITGTIMAILGDWFPVWLLIWGAFLAVHGLKVLPSAIHVINGQIAGRRPASLIESPATHRHAVAPSAVKRSGVDNEIAEVRALLAKRDDEEAARLAREVEQLDATMAELARRRADLEAQLSPDELRELEQARSEADLRLQKVTNAQDRDLLRKELAVVEQRHQAVEHALRTLERLRSQERMAHHQLKQLRLDLSQTRAQMVDLPDFADRVEAIRIEAAAIEEVEETLADHRRVPNRLSDG